MNDCSHIRSPKLPKTTVYSLTYKTYDWFFEPLAVDPEVDYLRYTSDTNVFSKAWSIKKIKNEYIQESQTLTNRFYKFFPKKVISDCDVAIYMDGNIFIKSDLTELSQKFYDSGADIGLFPHPSSRTLNEEIDFAKIHRIEKDSHKLVESQRKRYGYYSILNNLISENSIIFYRMDSALLDNLSSIWWNELYSFSKRDQISWPYAQYITTPKVYYFDFHFNDSKNPYFSRYAHKSGKKVTDYYKKCRFLRFYYKKYQILYYFLRFFNKIKVLKIKH